MKYKLEFQPNPDCIAIHITKRIVQNLCEYFDSPTDKVDVWEDNKIVGQKEPPIYIKRLFEVDGIVGIHLNQYSISLEKGSAFESIS